MDQNKDNVRSIILCLLDILGAVISYFVANYVWLGFVKGFNIIESSEIPSKIGLMIGSFVIVIFLCNSNSDFLRRDGFKELWYCLKINLIFAAVYAVLVFISRDTDDASRGVFVFTPLLNVFAMLGINSAFKSYLKRARRKNKKKDVQLFIITTSERAHDVIKELSKKANWMNCVLGMAIVDADMTGSEIDGVRVTADFRNMVEYVRKEAVDEVFIDVPYDSGNSLRQYIMELENMGVIVHLNIEILKKFKDFNKSLSMIGDTPVITFATNTYDASKLLIKRLIDIVGSIVGIIITLIVGLFLAPALLIESPGPLIFKQKRVGRNGRYFYLYKFRSMYKDAEERKKALMEKNEMKGLMFKMTDDPRITKVGKFIRRTSIDELPQFFNVLKGDMSLVGTRPPTVDEFKQYESYHKRRLSMKPGITGMWQVSGRSDIEDFEEVVKLDLEYIDNWCISLDIKILFKTIGAVFKHSGAR